MIYDEMARLDVLNVIQGINSETEFMEFRNMLARYFADKAQKAIDVMWGKGEITAETINNGVIQR